LFLLALIHLVDDDRQDHGEACVRVLFDDMVELRQQENPDANPEHIVDENLLRDNDYGYEGRLCD
jgi:hypothetical protein